MPMKLYFRDCVLEFETRQLWRAGLIVPLEPKMYNLLEILIKRRPAVVTNDELDELLWPNVYVARTSLTRLVSELRTVLGDTPRDSQVIRTAYKTGYAFCADVRSNGAERAGSAQLIWNGGALMLADGEHIAGRGAECSLVIDASTVSRRHARITLAGGNLTIEDLDSTNGTFVNGTRISAPTVLSNGNKIELGSEVLVVKNNNSAALTIRIGSR